MDKDKLIESLDDVLWYTTSNLIRNKIHAIIASIKNGDFDVKEEKSMAKNCWLVFNEEGYLVCTTNHSKPQLCDLYEEEESEDLK